MQPSPIPISLFRYLIAWKVNSSLVVLPEYLPVELSLVLGTIISNRLATTEAEPWRKAVTPLAEYHAQVADRNQNVTTPFPAAAWPLEAVLFAHPAKRTFGFGELIFWELKLLGESADHGLFLELILPALEEAGYMAKTQWHRPNRLWGNFEVNAVYVAHGKTWKPLVKDGKLDLRYRPTPVQWAEGLTFKPDSPRALHSLNWLTPFDLTGIASSPPVNAGADPPRAKPGDTLQIVVDALVARVQGLMVSRHKIRDGVAAILNDAGQAALQRARQEAARIKLVHKILHRTPITGPGGWIGAQHYAPITNAILPYLELAAILHVGKHTHLGCGTFRLS